MAADQVKQREQENPYDIDKVPVQAAQLHRRVVFPSELPSVGPQEQPAQQSETDDHVKSMQAGHGKVEREEYLGLPGGLLSGSVGRDLDLVALGLRVSCAVLNLFGNVAGRFVGCFAPAPGIEPLANYMSWNVAFVVFLVVLNGLNSQEGRTK